MSSRFLLPSAKTLVKSFSTATTTTTAGGVHVLPALPYAYSALEPAISANNYGNSPY
jgi:hypothetical protein